MVNGQPTVGGYGINYGTGWGLAEQPARVWSVRLEAPDGTERWLTGALLSVDLQPEHSALYDGEIEIAPVIDPATYRFGTMALFYDGERWLECDIESADTADDGTITLTGRESDGMTLVGDEIERTYSRRRVPDVIREFWRDETPYTATVHDPPADVETAVSNEVIQSARTPAEWDELLHARTRDEQGRYQEEEGGSAPNFEPTDPLQLTDRGVELRQSNWLRHGEDWDGAEEDVRRLDDESLAVDGSAAWLNTDGATVEYDIETGYDVPAGAFVVVPRWRCPPGEPNGTITIDVDDETVKTTAIQNVVPAAVDYEWRYPPRFKLREALSAGEHTITITKLGGTSVYVDMVAPCDNRFSYRWDTALDQRQQLGGPELYPDNYYMRLGKTESGIDVGEVAITTTYDRVVSDGEVAAFITGEGTVRSSVTATRQTAHFATETEVPRIVPYLRVSRGGERYGSTPTRGYESQVLQGVIVQISGEQVAVIPESGQTFDGDRLSILQALHEQAGYHFALKHGAGRDGGPTVESFKRGDPRRIREFPAAAGIARDSTTPGVEAITSKSTDESTESYKNQVTVIGADYPRGIRRDDDPRRFETTVKDDDEIADHGLHPVTITDTSLETQEAVRSRARSELQTRLAEDSLGASLDTTPLMIEPGYPYRIGALARTDPMLPRLTAGDVPADTERAVENETLAVWEDVAIAGTLRVGAGGRVIIAETASLSDSAGGAIVVEDSGVIETRSADDSGLVQTCESWSFSESAGSASSGGDFGQLGGRGGPGRENVLALLTGGLAD